MCRSKNPLLNLCQSWNRNFSCFELAGIPLLRNIEGFYDCTTECLQWMSCCNWVSQNVWKSEMFMNYLQDILKTSGAVENSSVSPPDVGVSKGLSMSTVISFLSFRNYCIMNNSRQGNALTFSSRNKLKSKALEK